MDRLTTNKPDTNFLTLMNFAFCGDGGATFLRYGGKPMVRLGDYMSEQCKKRGCDYDRVSMEAEDGFMGCFDCPLGILYYCAVQAAELRDRLAAYEDTGLTPEEITALIVDKLHRIVTTLISDDKRMHRLIDEIESAIKRK